jgi:hypothetical protein
VGFVELRQIILGASRTRGSVPAGGNHRLALTKNERAEIDTVPLSASAKGGGAVRPRGPIDRRAANLEGFRNVTGPHSLRLQFAHP